ncbi:unnamed protein product [Closterium sp. NIES-64]|nr:unnamed protein product [Closterium sp. NIES-64]
MWADSRVKQQWEFRRDSTGKVPFVMKKLRGEMVPYLTFEEVHAVASILERRHFSSEGKRLFPEGLEGGNDVAAAVSGLARVESSWQLTACRWETREYSTGLMQVLQSTAKSLEVQGYDAYIETAHNSFLYRPFEAMYYGMAYLSYLSHYKGIPHSEESVVRGYNGGPRGIYKPATEPYWNKYLQAKEMGGTVGDTVYPLQGVYPARHWGKYLNAKRYEGRRMGCGMVA